MGETTTINQPPLSGLFYDQELGTKLRTPRIGSVEWMKTRADHAAAIYNANYMDDGGRGDIIFIDPWTAVCPDGEYAAFHYHADALAWAIEQTLPSETQQRLDAVQRAWRAS